MPKKKKPSVISILEMESKSTKELLAYLTRLYQCEESFALSDWMKNPDLEDDSTIYFKQTDKWKMAYKHVKSILAKRENVT